MATTKHNPNLMRDFPPHTTQSWEVAAKKLLKGKPFEHILKTNTYEEILLEPLYSNSDLNNSEFSSSLPGEAPFTRGFESLNSPTWYFLKEVTLEAVSEPKPALTDKHRALLLKIDEVSILSQHFDQWKHFLKSNALSKAPIFINSFDTPNISSAFIQLLKDCEISLKELQGAIFHDPIANLINTKKWPSQLDKYFIHYAENIRWGIENTPDFSFFCIDATNYHNAGASAAQELAFGIAAAVESIRKMLAAEPALDFSTVYKNVNFTLSIGSNFFMEIAKLRALRNLWYNISKAFGGSEGHSKIKIHTQTSAWNKTILDEHTNILRSTTEAFSAILGGCDSLQISPFNFLSKETDGFSERIAGNIQLILKDEVHVGNVLDAAGGSWYVESLTKSLAEKAWQLFQEVEKKGGMVAALQQDFIQKSISETRSKRMRDIETRRSKIIGANIYPNLNEKDLKINTKMRRAVEPFEKLRIRIEAHAVKPEVLLLNYGAAEAYKPRADFARGFFEVAGFKVSENVLNEKLEVVLNSKTVIVTICSSDEFYPKFVPALSQKLKDQNSELKIMVAGNPTNHIDTFTKAGIDDFIHIKSNIYEMLNRLMQEIGIA